MLQINSYNIVKHKADKGSTGFGGCGLYTLSLMAKVNKNSFERCSQDSFLPVASSNAELQSVGRFFPRDVMR